ncbi:MAG: CvpA family protein [Desulfatibacillaceae bacterium]
MNNLDGLILLLLLWGLVRGWFRGFIKEICSIIAVFGGFYAAYTYYESISPTVLSVMPTGPDMNWEPILPTISFMIILAIVFLVISIAGVILKYFLKIASLGWFDKIAGSAFGVLKSVLLISVILVGFATLLPMDRLGFVERSQLSPHIMDVSAKMVDMVPPDMKETFWEKVQELRDRWQTE